MPASSLRRVVFGLCAALLLITAARAADKPGYPKFESLRASEVNLRAGPGEQYPIQWIYKRKGLPVEVIDSYDVWRKIRDSQGSTGWVHQRMLTLTRMAIIRTDQRSIYEQPARDSAVMAKLDPGVVVKLMECRNAWCRVQTEQKGIRGWLLRNEIWGVYPDEVVQ